MKEMACLGKDLRKWLVLKSFWFCLPLRTGTIIVATIEIILILAGLGGLIYFKVGGFALEFIDKLICDVLLNLVMSGLLLAGVLKAKRELIRGWMWLRLPLLFTDLGIVAFQSARVRNGTVFSTAAVSCLLVLHNLLVVWSFDVQMAKKETSVDKEAKGVPQL